MAVLDSELTGAFLQRMSGLLDRHSPNELISLKKKEFERLLELANVPLVFCRIENPGSQHKGDPAPTEAEGPIVPAEPGEGRKRRHYSHTKAEQFSAQVREITNGIAELLESKNRAYGDSALNPVRIFSKANAIEQLLVRIDDKLSRLERGSAAGEDVVQDLIGYLVMLRIAQKRASENPEPEETPINSEG